MKDPIKELRDCLPVEVDVCESDVKYRLGGHSLTEDMLREIIEQLEHEYMKLPVDADGVPIRIGDNVRLHPKGGIFTVRGVGVNSAGNPVMWGVRELNTHTTRHRLDGEVRHVQPDTVESLLEEALDDAAMLDRGVGYWPSAADITNIVNDYAERIRRVVD